MGLIDGQNMLWIGRFRLGSGLAPKLNVSYHCYDISGFDLGVGEMFTKALRFGACALAALFSAPVAQATTFTVDAANSSVSLTDTASGFICNLTNCGVQAHLAAGLAGVSFDLSSVGDSNVFDFLTFTGSGTVAASYSIAATLAFDPPSFSATNTGSGGVLVLGGHIVAGALFWDSVPTAVTLADGSQVAVNFFGGLGLFLGNSTTTNASLTLETLPASVPLPASGILLLAGIGGLAALRRRRSRTQA